MRHNEVIESYKSLHENRAKLAAAELAKENAKTALREEFVNDYYKIQDARKRREDNRARILEAARNDALASAIKAIYITALEAHTLTDQSIIIAESIVDQWIKENGGASAIMKKAGENTYFLSRLAQIVEDAAEEEVKEIEKDDDAEEAKAAEEADKSARDVALSAAKKYIDSASKDEISDFVSKINDTVDKKDEKEEKKEAEVKDYKGEEGEEPEAPAEDDSDVELELPAEEDDEPKASEDDSDDKSEEEPKDDAKSKDDEEVDIDIEDDETSEDSNDEEKEASADESPVEDEEAEVPEGTPGDGDTDLTDDEVDNSKDEFEDQDVKDALGDPLDDKEVEDANKDTTVDGDKENNGKLFDELDKEEDVQKAIELIRARVADAEETFIKNNAEDKKKMEEILDKISNNVKTVEDLNDENSDESKVAQEAVQRYRREMANLRNDRPQTVFESMIRKYTANVMKDEKSLTSYLDENGRLDTDIIVENVKVMYGFLETLSTLRIDNVNEAYLKNVLDNM